MFRIKESKLNQLLSSLDKRIRNLFRQNLADQLYWVTQTRIFYIENIEIIKSRSFVIFQSWGLEKVETVKTKNYPDDIITSPSIR